MGRIGGFSNDDDWSGASWRPEDVEYNISYEDLVQQLNDRLEEKGLPDFEKILDEFLKTHPEYKL